MAGEKRTPKDDASKAPSLAALYAADLRKSGPKVNRSRELIAAEITSLAGELFPNHHNKALVLLHVASALDGHADAAARVDEMASLTGPKRGRGRPTKHDREMFTSLVRHVVSSRERGDDEVTIARYVILMFDCFLEHSPHSAALHADQSKLVRLAARDAEKFVKAVHRALGYPGTDNLTGAARTANARTPERRQIRARAKARAARDKSDL